jgi:hypothetical protein
LPILSKENIHEFMKSLRNAGLVLCGAVLSLFVYACSAHSPFILTNTTDSTLAGSTARPPYQGKVFVTKQDLPANVAFTPVGTIDVGKIWYGSSDDALISMADRARELGANAIIDASTWHQPSGFSWAAPHGSGKAVWIDNINSLSAAGVAGEMY